MPDEFAYDVFLSHSAKDTDVMRELAEGLKKDGVKVWFEEWEEQGRKGPKRLEGMEQSRVMVLGLSENASGKEWERLEGETRRFRDPAQTQRRFAPLRLDDVAPRGEMAAFLCLDWRSGSREPEYSKLRHICRPVVKPASSVERAAAEKKSPKSSFQLDYEGHNIYCFALSPDRKQALSADDTIPITSGRLGLESACFRW